MIRTFFGSPGCGKTTLSVKHAIKNKRNYQYRFLNFEQSAPSVRSCDLEYLGDWTFPDSSYIGIDEVGIVYNNRAYKSLPKPAIAWFKKHRHYRCDIDVFSQSWEDMDVTLRRLTDELWYVKKIGPWTLSRRIYKYVTVDENSKQIIDGYRLAKMAWLLIWFLQLGYPFQKKFSLTFRPFYYKYFDSYSKDDIPVKDFS